jgi:hypothetical protein
VLFCTKHGTKKQITIYFILLFYVASTTTKWNDGPQIMIIGLEHIIFESKSVWLVEKRNITEVWYLRIL